MTTIGEWENPLLMVPGPVPVAPAVAAAAGAVPYHHADEFKNTFDEVRRVLAELLHCDGTVEIMPGGGRLGLESAIKSLLEPGDPVLVCSTGAFGEWLVSIAERCGAEVVVARWPPGRVVDDSAVAVNLACGAPSGRHYRAVAVVHCETSTGTVNALGGLGRLCRETDALLFVDAVSTVGVLPVDMASDGIDVCVTASQKGLGSLMGLSVVALGPRALATMSARTSVPGTFALDLRRWRNDPGAPTSTYPVVPSPSLVLALRQALRALEGGGLAEAHHRHTVAATTVRAAFHGAGLEVFGDSLSCGLTAIELPAGISAREVQRRVLKRHGIWVATGMGPLAERLVRLSHMGIQAERQRVEVAVRAIVEECRDLGMAPRSRVGV